MSVLPTRIQDLIEFCEIHAKAWNAAPTTIGLTSQMVTEFSALTGAARGAYTAAQEADDARRDAYIEQRTAINALRNNAAALVAVIKSFAETKADPSAVYSAASLPMPQPPSPAPAPGTPTNFVATINQTGAVTLNWKCQNPSGTVGTIYEVSRSINGGAMTSIGASGARSFTDETLPAGSTGVVYRVTAVRSTKRGQPALFNVNFGVSNGGGLFIASTSENVSPVKMAA